jgi:hypothetical protein
LYCAEIKLLSEEIFKSDEVLNWPKKAILNLGETPFSGDHFSMMKDPSTSKLLATRIADDITSDYAIFRLQGIAEKLENVSSYIVPNVTVLPLNMPKEEYESLPLLPMSASLDRFLSNAN